MASRRERRPRTTRASYSSRPHASRHSDDALDLELSRGDRAMATFTVKQGKRYRATISLGLVERLASNDMIADRLRAAGVTDITVSGSGATRVAEAFFLDENATAEMPSQITDVVDA